MRVQALVLAAFVGGCGAEATTAAAEEQPAPPRAPLDPRPSACGECHGEIVEQWRGSLHARAWSDEVFRAEYDRAPAASCRDCHNPPTRAPEGEGIDCATCHLREGRILALHDGPEASAAHPITLEPALAGPESCARCHQFTFTDDGVHDPSEALQNTVAEWRASEAATEGRDCRSCHMPEGDHSLLGLDDPALLAGAVELELAARRAAEAIEVEVRLRGARIGHAFPTGDLFRQGRLIVTSEDGSEASLSLQRHLARTADADGEDLHVRTVDDTRVPAPGTGELRELLRIADPDARTLSWRLELHRLPRARARERGLSEAATVVEIDRGVLTEIDSAQ
ncbi:MAG: hypothetical protein KC457_06390 [Myxococcales bacterium]|nr:hypothetical protein [Myxococcales bacterium]